MDLKLRIWPMSRFYGNFFISWKLKNKCFQIMIAQFHKEKTDSNGYLKLFLKMDKKLFELTYPFSWIEKIYHRKWDTGLFLSFTCTALGVLSHSLQMPNSQRLTCRIWDWLLLWLCHHLGKLPVNFIHKNYLWGGYHFLPVGGAVCLWGGGRIFFAPSVRFPIVICG